MINISQTYGRIGIETQNAKINITSTKPQINIEQKQSEIEIKTELPQVKIDQYECFAEVGLKNNYDLIKETAELAKQQSMDYIAKMAMDGDMLAAIENETNPIADIAERDAYPEYEYNIDLIPKSRPKIDFTASIDIRAKPGKIEYKLRPGNLTNNYTPGNVKIYMAQEPSLKFEYIGKNMNIQI